MCLIKVDGVTVSELFQELGLILWRMSERIITFQSVSDRGCPSSGYDHLSPTLMSLPIVRYEASLTAFVLQGLKHRSD